VRLFPRTARRRLGAAAAAVALAIGVVSVPLAHADDKLHHRQHEVQSQIKKADHDLDESSSALRAATARLDAAQADLDRAKGELQRAKAKLAAAKVRDREMRAKLADAEQRLADAETALADGRDDLDAQREAVTDTINAIYQGSNTGLLTAASFLKAQSTEELTREAEMQDVMVSKQTRAYDELRAAEVMLEVREKQVEDARDDVAVQRRAAAEHLVTMRKLHATAKDARARFKDTVAERRGARQQALQARAHDRKQLAKLHAQERHIKQLIAAQAAKAHGGYKGPTGGLLIPPVTGPVTSPFGWRIHPIYGYWGLHDGTDFGVSCGEGMRAVAGGTVISRYYSSVYGNRLYLSLGQINGKNVTAVYNHATGYRVGVGDHVNQGEIVGYVGSTGWSTGCHLHFTILVNGTAVDPMNWL
jgi:murein DD-endopeptidase MepM/ murein hydrolase activator NlpD